MGHSSPFSATTNVLPWHRTAHYLPSSHRPLPDSHPDFLKAPTHQLLHATCSLQKQFLSSRPSKGKCQLSSFLNPNPNLIPRSPQLSTKASHPFASPAPLTQTSPDSNPYELLFVLQAAHRSALQASLPQVLSPALRRQLPRRPPSPVHTRVLLAAQSPHARVHGPAGLRTCSV